MHEPNVEKNCYHERDFPVSVRNELIYSYFLRSSPYQTEHFARTLDNNNSNNNNDDDDDDDDKRRAKKKYYAYVFNFTHQTQWAA